MDHPILPDRQTSQFEPPPDRPQPRRTTTANSVASHASGVFSAARRAMSFKDQARQPQAASGTSLKERTFPVYRLDWEKLKHWLELKFPTLKETFEERRVIDDHYSFYIPESLTSVDEREIMNLRTSTLQRRPDSPEV